MERQTEPTSTSENIEGIPDLPDWPETLFSTPSGEATAVQATPRLPS
jgi:hypothetical protein